MKRILSIICLSFFVEIAMTAQQHLTIDDVVNSDKVISLKKPAQAKKSDRMTNSLGTFALDFINRKKVWRYETRGDYQLTNLKTGDTRRLGSNRPLQTLMFAKFSPDGRKVAYVTYPTNDNEGWDIVVEDVDPANGNDTKVADGKDGNAPRVLTDGITAEPAERKEVVNGTFDWVYEEEFGCRDGFRWSGDSRYIAFWQSNTSGTGWFDIINNVDGIYPKIQRFPYPKAGTRNSAVRVGIVDVETGKKTWIPIPGDARENYIPRMEFVPGTNRLMIQQMNRQQSVNSLWYYTIGDREPQLLTQDKDETWVETNDKIHWLSDNKFFTFCSERDGWRHLYRVSADGKQWTCITDVKMDVIDEVAYDEKRGYIYFSATPEDQATERYLYRTQVMGNGKVEGPLLLGKREKGQYSYTFEDGFDTAIERFSNAVTPPQYRKVVMDAKGNWKIAEVLEENLEAKLQLESRGIPKKEFVKVQSGKYLLDAWIIKPRDFDPKKKYPVIDFVYGEPANSTVQNRWETTLFWQYLADQGFVIVSIDNRGANTPRGREWRKCIYGRIGVNASEDQTVAIQVLCDRYAWMDRSRLGVTGWSGGGSTTLHCIMRYPDVWKTGVAIAPVTDLKLYDTIYEERYMNTPQQNPEGYREGSAVNLTEGLKGNLLLIHGTGDDNVHYQNIEMLTNKLIENNKLFYQLSYPMRTHSISERDGTARHLRMQITDFFKRNL